MSSIYDYSSPFVFIGTAEKIEHDKAMMSMFRESIGCSSDPFGPIIGTEQEVNKKTALLKAFKANLK